MIFFPFFLLTDDQAAIIPLDMIKLIDSFKVSLRGKKNSMVMPPSIK